MTAPVAWSKQEFMTTAGAAPWQARVTMVAPYWRTLTAPWRRTIAQEVNAHAARGAAVHEIGCGLGIGLVALWWRRPDLDLRGWDASSGACVFAREAVPTAVIEDAIVTPDTPLPPAAVITTTFTLAYAPPDQALAFLEAWRAVAPTLVLAEPWHADGTRSEAIYYEGDLPFAAYPWHVYAGETGWDVTAVPLPHPPAALSHVLVLRRR